MTFSLYHYHTNVVWLNSKLNDHVTFYECHDLLMQKNCFHSIQFSQKYSLFSNCLINHLMRVLKHFAINGSLPEIYFQSVHFKNSWKIRLTALLKFPCTSPSTYKASLKRFTKSMRSTTLRSVIMAWYFCITDQRWCSRICNRRSLNTRNHFSEYVLFG